MPRSVMRSAVMSPGKNVAIERWPDTIAMIQIGATYYEARQGFFAHRTPTLGFASPPLKLSH
jgi:hypothetical protein